MLSSSFVFIRHGQAESCINDIERPLSQSGILQAKKRAQIFREYQFDAVITSSAIRAKQTVNCIIDALHISPIIVELDELYQPRAIKDRDNVNLLLNKLGSFSLDIYLEQDKDSSWETYTQGAYIAIQKYIKKLNAKSILIVAHGNIINSLGLCINPLAKELIKIYFNYCEGFALVGHKLTIIKDNNK